MSFDQNPGRDWQSFLGDVSFTKPDNMISIEEKLHGVRRPQTLKTFLQPSTLMSKEAFSLLHSGVQEAIWKWDEEF